MILLAVPVSKETIKARYQNGVLKVMVPKSETVRPKRARHAVEAILEEAALEEYLRVLPWLPDRGIHYDFRHERACPVTFAPLMPYLAIFAALLAAGIGGPIPEGVTVITAGILAARGDVNFWLALGTCWVGAILDDCCWYFVGYRFGHNILRNRHLWTYFVRPDRQEHMEELIHKHGLKVLFAARFLVGIRSAIYLAASIRRVRFERFLLTDLFAATVVVGTFFVASYWWGPMVGVWLCRAEVALTVVILVAATGLTVWLWREYRQKRKT